MKEFDNTCEKTIEVFDDYDGRWLYWGNKSMDTQLTKQLQEYIKRFGSYFLNTLPSYSEVFINGYISKEVVNIKGRQLYQDVFVIDRVWNSQCEEYESGEIEDAIYKTETTKMFIYNG